MKREDGSYVFKNEKELKEYMFKMFPIPADSINLSDNLFHIMANMKHDREETFVSYFSSNNSECVINKHSEGTIDKCPIWTRELLKECFKQKALGIIIWHTHPSGDITPSVDDDITFKTLFTVLRISDISLLDFVIVNNKGDTYSYIDNGRIEPFKEIVDKVIKNLTENTKVFDNM